MRSVDAGSHGVASLRGVTTVKKMTDQQCCNFDIICKELCPNSMPDNKHSLRWHAEAESQEGEAQKCLGESATDTKRAIPDHLEQVVHKQKKSIYVYIHLCIYIYIHTQDILANVADCFYENNRNEYGELEMNSYRLVFCLDLPVKSSDTRNGNSQS